MIIDFTSEELKAVQAIDDGYKSQHDKTLLTCYNSTIRRAA